MIEVRPTEMGDAKHLKDWILAQSEYFPMGDLKEIEETAKRWVEVAVEQKSGLTALYQGTPVGFGILFLQNYVRLTHQAVHILVVDKSYQQMGIGSKLLNALMERGRELGVELLHVEVYDEAAIERFYKRHGFVEFARQERWTKDHDIYRARVCLERFL